MISINDREHLAKPADEPIAYRKRVRKYYLALGYDTPYQWAHYKEVPFTRLAKPLTDARVALVTTAAPYQPEKGDQGPGASYNGAAKFFSVYEFDVNDSPDLRISHIAYDRQHTHAEDSNSWLPVAQLQLAAKEKRIGGLCSSGFGFPTNRSQRTNNQVDCPDLLARMQSYSVDAAVLVPNCPVCHQSLSLAARVLEAAGIATVIMGCAKDIVEYIGVPRFLFSDFPLGNSAGKPHSALSQQQTLSMALELLESATAARTTVQSPQQFEPTSEWKKDYYNVEQLSAAELQQLREEFDQQKRAAGVK